MPVRCFLAQCVTKIVKTKDSNIMFLKHVIIFKYPRFPGELHQFTEGKLTQALKLLSNKYERDGKSFQGEF